MAAVFFTKIKNLYTVWYKRIEKVHVPARWQVQVQMQAHAKNA
jgi:hypothetical protein